jgi:hypothetical protein
MRVLYHHLPLRTSSNATYNVVFVSRLQLSRLLSKLLLY